MFDCEIAITLRDDGKVIRLWKQMFLGFVPHEGLGLEFPPPVSSGGITVDAVTWTQKEPTGLGYFMVRCSMDIARVSEAADEYRKGGWLNEDE